MTNTTLLFYIAKIAPSEPTVSWRSVLPQVEETLDGKYNDFNATLEYLAMGDGSVALTHVIQVQNEETNAWYEAYIDAHTGELVSVTDFVAEASVRCFLLFLSEMLASYTFYAVHGRPCHEAKLRRRC